MMSVKGQFTVAISNIVCSWFSQFEGQFIMADFK